MSPRPAGPPTLAPPVLDAAARAVGTGQADAAGQAEDAWRAARLDSRHGVEIYLSARPEEFAGGFEAQARSMYAHLIEGLRAHGASWGDVVAERLFLRDVETQAGRIATIRREVCGDGPAAAPRATTVVRQPPAAARRQCEMQALALRPAGGGALVRRAVGGVPGRGTAVVVETGGPRRLFLSGATGGRPGDGLEFQDQAAAMFRGTERALRRAGLSFRNVARTWFFLADIGRDYAGLNRARREFFAGRRIHPPPASTGIGGIPYPPDRACALDLQAFGGSGPLRVAPFGSAAMNEAPTYGADFSRGLRVDLEDRAVLYVSGTASIDGEGRVVAPGDIDAQLERMLQNVEGLLAGQGAGWADVASAVTYLKDAAHTGSLRRAAARHGLPGATPNTLCVADICRPEWLCEIEATAVLRRQH